MNAIEARKAADAVRAKINRRLDKEREVFLAEQERERKAIWKERGLMWIAKIEGFIKKAINKGDHYLWEPNTTNPNGSDIIYIGKGDFPIQDMLMDHFRGLGFTVEEYQYGGMKITW